MGKNLFKVSENTLEKTFGWVIPASVKEKRHN